MTVDPDSGLLSPVRAGTPAEASTGDEAWLRAMLDAEAALARAQARLGTVPPEAADAITDAAGSARIDVVELARGSRATANPVVGLVKALTSAVGAIAPGAEEYVHRGSTSQDIFDTAMMLVADRTLRPLAADLDATAEALAELARTHRDTTMAGRTLTAHAVPTTFGLKAAGWRQLVLDAAVRIRRVLDGGLPVSLGGAAGTLAAYVEYARLAGEPHLGRASGGGGGGGGDASTPARDSATSAATRDAVGGDYAERLTAAFAEETGLAAPVLPWHSLRTPVVDLAGALAFTAGALGKLAVDVETLSRTELGEVAEPAAGGRGGSSAMPHKRNPVLATLIRSAALQVPVLAAGVTQSMLTEDERSAGVWHAEWQLIRECLRLTGGAAHTAAELARGLTAQPGRMRDNLASTHGLIVSERLSAVLAPLLGKATAKELLGEASQRAVREDRPLRDVLDELPAVTGVLTPAALDELLDPGGYTGAAGALVDRALREREPELGQETETGGASE
ncbi:class-II fumarase/aspartase family protein [Amycolatopsis vastitatis]|uniref:3-carboxy-cis,cis-muconate cycloisomerase n=1 Tax=Amycolatopsis vastitatis TaxID=1905142 RepID=A0A229TL25_9PSEU|nr:adenylosuccinate lyase family protein [Amycolatopsis vastitatis]OXM71651.1 3-carboxy-cis,cis-muconate cycloisomerase [Amycolatopsis vastitatis]